MIMQGINFVSLTKIFHNRTTCARNDRFKVSEPDVLTVNDKWAPQAASARRHRYNNRLIAFAHLASIPVAYLPALLP